MASGERSIVAGGISTPDIGTKLCFVVSPKRQARLYRKPARYNAVDHLVFGLGMACLRWG